jgi:hypothetical protein
MLMSAFDPKQALVRTINRAHMSRDSEQQYAETVSYVGSAAEGVIFIKVVGMPEGYPVEFDLAQARAFAEELQKAIDEVASGWAGGR